MLNKQYFSRILNIPIVKNIGILVGGTAFSQLIGIIALPILTRLYTPEDFTVLATFSSILAILMVVSCLRFEIAIPIPKDEETAIQLLALSILSVVFITILSLVVVFVGESQINDLTNNRLNEYLWLIPIGVFFAGLYKALQFWTTRVKGYKLIAKTRMSQSLSAVAIQIGCGSFGLAPIGLLIGQIVNSGAGFYGLLKSFLSSHKLNWKSFKIIKLKGTFTRYDRFPKISTWEALFNSAGIQLPLLIIASFAIGEEAGFLMLAMRLLSAPMGLIGGSVAQVYLSDAAVKHQNGDLKVFTRKIIFNLLKVGLIPFLLIGVCSPFLVPVFFGEDWQRTGFLISWMIPWFYIQFIASPVSISLHICGLQGVALFLQLFGLLLRGGGVIFSLLYFPDWVGEIYALSGFLFYLIYIGIILKMISDLDS
ncbi:lipopolysaccharide biosynthesis protein [Pseudoalteromonas sp. JSTW]|uniref:lipopolysaccharide biosynthesis protein n=1 Tax=Pseudoalteromonas sp. JSTW TaxID=2752475 RepID=UPI0015D528A2|nr:oligosaccharide flippase family protein [Pseudoalteromonas sp. JSTW]QLJ07988.1 oligosaccharide flippase family protein [Pseudoalteromonas sp. JSTW]